MIHWPLSCLPLRLILRTFLLGFGPCMAVAAGLPAWQIDGRCVASVCVGDTVYSLQKALPQAELRRTPTGRLDVRADGQRLLTIELEPGPDEPMDEARIALIDVLRPGTQTGLPGAALGSPAPPLQALGATQLADPGRLDSGSWWRLSLGTDGASRTYPVAYAVDGQGRLDRARINGANQRETAFSDLDAALRAQQTRLLQLQPAQALMPTSAPQLHLTGEVFASLTLTRQRSSLRISSRPDCELSACEVLAVEIGGPAEDDGADQPARLADGSPSRWRPTRCGGSCTPALMQFQRRGQTISIRLETGFAALRGAGLDASRDLQLLLQLADSIAH